MSERRMTFTEGEWKRDGLAVAAFGRGVIARCPTPQDGGTMECTANARLIENAPALLASLREIIASIADYEKSNNIAPNPGRKYCWDSVERAAGVIARIDG